MRPQKIYLKRLLLEKYGTTSGCPGCEMRGGPSEEYRRRFDQEIVDAGEAFDTEAMKRPRSTDDIKADDTAESETKKARPDLDETARDLMAKVPAVDSLLCATPSIDLSNDAMVWSRKCAAAGLEKRKTRELDTLRNKPDAFDDISELPRGHNAYDMVWVG